MYSLVIVDDEKKFVQLVKKLIDWERLDLNLVGTAHNGLDALELIQDHQPDIAVLDIRMPGMNGIQLIQKCREIAPNVRFIIISGYRHFEYAHEAIKFGVEDYLLKPLNQDDLNGTLRKIVNNLSHTDSLIQKSRKIEKDSIHSTWKSLLLEISQPDWKPLKPFKSQPVFPWFFVLVQTEIPLIEASQNELELLFSKSQNIIKKTLKKSPFDTILIQQNFLHTILLRDAEGVNIDDFCNTLIDSLQKLHEIFHGLHVSLSYSGLILNIQEISPAYQHTKNTLYNRFFTQGSPILPAQLLVKDDKRIETGSHGMSFEQRTQIRRASEHLDAQTLISEFDQMIQSLPTDSFDSGIMLLQQIKEFMHTMSRTIISCFNISSHFAQEAEEMALSIETYGTASEIISAAKVFIQKRIEEIREQVQETQKKPVNDAKNYIQEFYFKNISLELMSQHLNLNPSYFSNLFKKTTGQGFLEYLTTVRMNEAKELLNRPHCSIADAAFEVGYKDVKHFSKLFKKATGLTPSSYKKLYSS